MSRQDLIGKKIDFVPEERWPETEKAIARMTEGKTNKEIADLLLPAINST